MCSFLSSGAKWSFSFTDVTSLTWCTRDSVNNMVLIVFRRSKLGNRGLRKCFILSQIFILQSQYGCRKLMFLNTFYQRTLYPILSGLIYLIDSMFTINIPSLHRMRFFQLTKFRFFYIFLSAIMQPTFFSLRKTLSLVVHFLWTL